jgi:acetolactate synthase I/II/III large subunit
MNASDSRMTGGQALAQQLLQAGVRHVFGVPGVQLDWAVDGLASLDGAIRYVVPRHEQATAYMADGYARSRGGMGVCMVVPGPGVLNASAALSTAYACCSRVLLVAGQIASPFIGRNLGMLHEVREQSRIIASVTKWGALVRQADEVPRAVREALDAMHSGTPRPVAVEIPPDVLSAACKGEVCSWTVAAPALPDSSQVAAAARLLREARFPLIIAGGGVLAASAYEELQSLAERLQAPVVMTEDGNGSLSAHHPLAVSALGGRALLPHADAVLGVGTRFVDSRGLPLVDAAKARVVLMNSESADMETPREAAIRLQCDARAGLAALTEELHALPRRASRSKEVQLVRDWCDRQIVEIEPQLAWVKALRASIPEEGILVNELTQVGYVANIAYPVHSPRSFITPGYQGTLGYGWATALGAAVGNPERPVVCIAGDGGFGWNLQELATAKAYGLRAVIVVFNDSALGNVKRMQLNQFGRTLGSDLVNPDFVKLAQAFGLDAARVSTPAALRGALGDAIAAKRPALIEVPVQPMPSAWHLLRSHYTAHKAPPNPLGEPAKQTA